MRVEIIQQSTLGGSRSDRTARRKASPTKGLDDVLVLQETPQKLHGCCSAPPLLDQDVEHLALIVDGAPLPTGACP